MKRAQAETDADDARIIAAYVQGAGLRDAIAALPNRSANGLQVRACTLRKRGLIPAVGAKKPQPAAPRVFHGVQVPPPKLGPLDLGEEELVRGWLDHFVVDAAWKLHRTPIAVRNAIKAIAARGFAKDASLRWTIDPESVNSIGVEATSVPRQREVA